MVLKNHIMARPFKVDPRIYVGMRIEAPFYAELRARAYKLGMPVTSYCKMLVIQSLGLTDVVCTEDVQK